MNKRKFMLETGIFTFKLVGGISLITSYMIIIAYVVPPIISKYYAENQSSDKPEKIALIVMFGLMYLTWNVFNTIFSNKSGEKKE